MAKKIQKKMIKNRKVAVSVYLDDETRQRFYEAINTEQGKQIKENGVSTISKSNFCEAQILKWLDKYYPK
jgi:hypothetical protein